MNNFGENKLFNLGSKVSLSSSGVCPCSAFPPTPIRSEKPEVFPRVTSGFRFFCFDKHFEMNKKGVVGEGVIMIYRLILLSFIVLVILGISAVYYEVYIDVRDAEAQIMAQNVVDCLSPKGILDLDSYPPDLENNLLFYCGYGVVESERFYVRAVVLDESGDEVKKLNYGDSGLEWVKDVFSKTKVAEGVRRYEPGYFPATNFSSYINDGGRKFSGKINVEVIMNNEF